MPKREEILTIDNIKGFTPVRDPDRFVATCVGPMKLHIVPFGESAPIEEDHIRIDRIPGGWHLEPIY